MSKSNKNLHLYDVVFLSHTCGLNHERTTLTEAQAKDPKKAVKAVFDESFNPGMGDDVFIKPVKPSDDHILCRLVYTTHNSGDIIETRWLPKDYKKKDDEELVEIVFEETFEPERDEFLCIEELPESDLNVGVVEW